MKHKGNFKSQKGFTLIEISIVLAVIAVLAVMGNAGIGIYKQSKNEKESQTVLRIASALQSKFRYDAATTGLTNTTVNNSGILLKTGWSGTGANIKHSMKGAVTFAPATILAATPDDAFSILMAKVPYDSCGDIGRAVSQNAEKVTIGTTAVQLDSATRATGSAIDTACGSTGVQNMTFVFNKNP